MHRFAGRLAAASATGWTPFVLAAELAPTASGPLFAVTFGDIADCPEFGLHRAPPPARRG